MRRFLLALLLISGFALSLPVHAAPNAAPDEAKAMAVRAAEFLRTAGQEKAFAAFNANDSQFHDRDLYVFAWTTDGMCVAHGANPVLIGRNLLNLKDIEGKPIGNEFVAVSDASWISYKWQNPQTKGIEHKTSYVVRVDNFIVGVGAYKQ
jgi:cytochrome c